MTAKIHTKMENKTNKYLRIKYHADPNKRAKHNMIVMPRDFEAFKFRIAELYKFDLGKEEMYYGIDGYRIKLPEEYCIVLDHDHILLAPDSNKDEDKPISMLSNLWS